MYKITAQEKILLLPILFLQQIFCLWSLLFSGQKAAVHDILYSYLWFLLKYKLSISTKKKIQLSALIATFHVTRNLIVTDT